MNGDKPLDAPDNPRRGRDGAEELELIARLSSFVTERRLGYVFDGQTGFRLPNGNLRCPDASFVAAHRLPGGEPVGFLHVVPDLAVEVLSPIDPAGDVAHKVGEYLSVGAGLLWVIDPDKRSAVAYRPASTPRSIREDGALEGDDALPGFSCPLREILGKTVVSP